MRTCRRTGSILFILLGGIASHSAHAIDFSPLPLVVAESFLGENVSPATPDVDHLGTAGIIVDGTLTGSAAHLDIDFVSDFVDTASFQPVDEEALPTHGSDHGFRADFEGLSVTTDGSVTLATGGIFSPVGSGLSVQIVAGVTVTKSVGGNSASFRLGEVDFTNPDNTTLTPLLESEADQILSGAAVRIDARINHAFGEIHGELFIGGALVSTHLLMLSAYSDHTLSAGFAVLSGEPPSPSDSATVDLLLLETYAQPLMFEPLHNIDVGGAAGSPLAVFGGAGSPGVWNAFTSTGTLALADVDGVATAASATLASQPLLNFGSGYTSDLAALFGDVGKDCADPDEWSVDLSGLSDGLYRMIVYAPAGADSETGVIAINAQPTINSLPGVFPHSLIEGTSWGSALAVVTGGSLSVVGTGSGVVDCAALTGLQLEIGIPIPIEAPSVPSLNRPAIILLITVFAALGLRPLRGQRHAARG